MSFWNEDRVELLKRLWAEGLSAGQIEARMRAPSRSAVIGKVHRLGLPGRATTSRFFRSGGKKSGWKKREKKPIATKQPIKRGPVFVFAPCVEPIPPPTVDDVPRKALLDLGDSDCRWPVNDPRDSNFGFCALPREPGKPYCGGHLRRAEPPTVPHRRPSPATPNPSAPEAMEMGGGIKETVG